MNSNQITKGIKHIYNNDVKIARIIDKAGKCELKPHNNYYYSLLKAIVGQQLSVKAAASINKRFFTSFFFSCFKVYRLVMYFSTHSLDGEYISYNYINKQTQIISIKTKRNWIYLS